MTLQCFPYAVDKLPPRFAERTPMLERGSDGNLVAKLYMRPRYKITDRGLYGCYAKWLFERFPNLRHLSLPAFIGEFDYPCDCPACTFISIRSSDELGMTAILESLGALKNLTSLEWKGCPMLRDEHLEAISETLPQLECLILDGSGVKWYEEEPLDQTVSNKGFRALAKLTSLRKLHIDIANKRKFDDSLSHHVSWSGLPHHPWPAHLSHVPLQNESWRSGR